MTLLALGRRRTIDLSDPRPLVLDWDRARTIVTVADCAGVATLREQDDVIPDPDGPHPFVFYFTGARTGDVDASSYVWRTTSSDGITWAAPVECTAAGVALRGQDPSIVQTFGAAAPTLYRDGSDLMWMYLENNTSNMVDVLSSTDGVAWTVAAASVIPVGAGGQWDASLTGSPVARHDGTRFIVGYEGIASEDGYGLAIGTSATSLTKHAGNPVITPNSLGVVGTSAFCDSMWVADGKVHLTGHSGNTSGLTMFRASTDNLDPGAWTDADLTLVGVVDPTVRNDLTADLATARLVTAPTNDLSLVTVPLEVAP